MPKLTIMEWFVVFLTAVVLVLGCAWVFTVASSRVSTTTAAAPATAPPGTPGQSASGATGGTPSTLSGKLTIAGSSAMLPLAQEAATQFQKLNPGVSIALSAGGSGAGRSGVCKGDLDIGNSDVPLT